MAYTTIDDGSLYFHTQLYTGDGSSNNAVTNDANSGDFKPDWLWIKSRSYSDLHAVFDSSRGRDKRIFPNLSNAEGSSSPDNFLKSFDTDGFTTGNDAGMNTSSGTLVAWQWKANGGTTSSNSDGSITSTVQANTTSGFSIVTYTGTGSGGATVGHGLGTKPKILLIKSRSNVESWQYWIDTTSNGTADKRIVLNQTDGNFNNHFTSFQDTTFTLPSQSDPGWSGSSSTYVAYCFTEKQGYSKFGSYTGNGNADGTFVYTGFKPSWVMIKQTDVSGENWGILDVERSTINPIGEALFADASGSESVSTIHNIDLISNGFKMRTTHTTWNTSASTYIYMAFAEHPFVSSKGVPTTAR